MVVRLLWSGGARAAALVRARKQVRRAAINKDPKRDRKGNGKRVLKMREIH